MTIALPSLQTIALRGPDAIAFAHAQFSSDVRTLANGCWQFSAWLSPQGRVRAFFHLLRDDDEHLRLLLRGGDARELVIALRRFIFRSKVELLALDEVEVFGCTNADVVGELCGGVAADTIISDGHQRTNLAIPGDPSRWLMLVDSGSTQAPSNADDIDQNQWMITDIRAGLIELDQALQDQFLPQWLGLNRLGAVSVAKGCYPGQEIMARLHFKGGNKRSLYRVEFDGDCVPTPGTQIIQDGERQDPAGQILMAASTDKNHVLALATLRDDLGAAPLQIIDSAIGAISLRSRFE